jgi:CTP-dependent riboflavin kinase
MSKINEIEQLALGIVYETGGITAQELSREGDIGYSTACAILADLQERKILERVYVGHGALFGMTTHGLAIFAKLKKCNLEERPIFLVGFDNLE